MVPSSFITSQMTPAGIRPASRARSTAASVCPVRSSTPPARALSGNTCPGWTRSRGEHQVALVLAVLVVDHHDHPALADLLDDLLDGGEHALRDTHRFTSFSTY